MKILILGMDGYIGWPLALHQLARGNEVYGVDNLDRRKNVQELGSWSAIPILTIQERIKNLKRRYGNRINFTLGSILDPQLINNVVMKFQPDAIVHLAEQPSAPFSMIDQQHASNTQYNNVMGTFNLIYAIKNHCPNTHLVKLGTMGEYGYDSGLDIPEGFFEIEYKGKKAMIPYPKQAGSWYHWSKVHDSNNIMFACKLWGLKSTDIMQGIVYGTRTQEIIEEEDHTRYDFDEAFGTAINRFCAQAVINHPLTPYGKGKQKRGFLALNDSIQCISLLIENPPTDENYRVVNQFDEQYSIDDLAHRVKNIGNQKGLNVEIKHIENPRVESEDNYYNAEHQKLKELGFKPTNYINDEISKMLDDLIVHKDRIEKKRESIIKILKWRDGEPQDLIP
ncbi:NAD-dependent epimerase/dehydratase family protein [Nitrosopumilus sp. K4]|uniref:UDP-sulfoquinovose synthase n=1 Tax=Nitrosopumilus sp. K4 TaxID=2795383 RepID=UPI001BA85AD5|nr:UDP-sulfoquinovose synthase [Nitrosopumilus sp. K4]QUC64514.1 NAD-dependent epimerase/dehydratase family protein [Nitrosopumilus sp. K4]